MVILTYTYIKLGKSFSIFSWIYVLLINYKFAFLRKDQKVFSWIHIRNFIRCPDTLHIGKNFRMPFEVEGFYTVHVSGKNRQKSVIFPLQRQCHEIFDLSTVLRQKKSPRCTIDSGESIPHNTLFIWDQGVISQTLNTSHG